MSGNIERYGDNPETYIGQLIVERQDMIKNTVVEKLKSIIVNCVLDGDKRVYGSGFRVGDFHFRAIHIRGGAKVIISERKHRILRYIKLKVARNCTRWSDWSVYNTKILYVTFDDSWMAKLDETLLESEKYLESLRERKRASKRKEATEAKKKRLKELGLENIEW